VRELRELVRYRAKLVQLRTGLKAQVHAVMAKEGVLPGYTEMFGIAGNAQLDAMNLAPSYTTRVESLRDAIIHYDREVLALERRIHQQLRHDRGYQAIQAIPGVGRTIAAIFVAEIGDVSRFANAEALTSWAGPRAPASGVGHQGGARPDHQSRLEARAVGSDRSSHRPPGRHQVAR
jgi:transposase